MSKRMFIMAGLLCLFAARDAVSAATLVPTGANWKYRKGTNEVSNPRSVWRQRTYDDSAWTNGPAPFAYGEPSFAGGTALSDMRNSYASVFLRRAFQVSDTSAVAALELRAVCDDGFIAWINGAEVARYNVPDGDLAFSAFASTAGEFAWVTNSLPDPRTYIVSGQNVLAVHVFNGNLGSSDLVMDAALVTVTPDTVPPTIVSLDPAPGNVSSLTQITVTFSEPVAGVDALDLSVNGLGASSVTGSGAVYTFTFPQPAFGDVTVAIAMNHGIRDLGFPGNLFNEEEPPARWQFNLLDSTKPAVATLNPIGGGTVRRLTQVEVAFTEAVAGVDPGDLLVNGEPASAVTGLGAGPYIFQFPEPATGAVDVQFASNSGIVDFAEPPNALSAAPWRYTFNPAAAVPDLVINEILAANEIGFKDEDGEFQDWIEIYNRSSANVNLAGWSLSDDPDDAGQWVFPSVNVGPRQYVVVFASGKDRRPGGGAGRLHTNFKLSGTGEYIGLFNSESPREAVDEIAPEYPEQRNDVSFGRNSTNAWVFFEMPTPGVQNGGASLVGATEPVHFSARRGFYSNPFKLHLTCETPGSTIRYTTNASVPTLTNGFVYSSPVTVDRTMMIRAAAFTAGKLPSRVATHTFLYNINPATRRGLPALSLVTQSNNLYGVTGIMETNPRNTTKHGIAWERPVSVEYIRVEDNDGFTLDAGLRVQGGNYIRQRYNYRQASPPEGKYSFRLYFRGDYGASKLEFPWFGDIPVQSFDHVVLRAGMNDPTNPFVRDELVRRLAADMGQVSPLGAFVNLFLLGTFKGYYNPCERIDSRFLQAWHGGSPDWDVIAQSGELREGDAVEWNSLRSFISSRDPAIPANWDEITRRFDVTNFADYLLVNAYAAMADWPHNNWRAARDRAPGGIFRFYPWDGEWSFGFRNGVAHNSFANEFTTATEIGTLYTRLRRSPEFKLLFADRIQKHFFNKGALSDSNVLTRFLELKTAMAGALPAMQSTIQTSWVPQRRPNLLNHARSAGFAAFTNAPAFSQHGGKVPRGFGLTMTATNGSIYFTLDGSDPRVPFTGGVAPSAKVYSQPVLLDASLIVKARALAGTNWSALTEAAYQINEIGGPLRITEINYNPSGGDAYEFVELQNVSSRPVDVSGMRFDGITYTFNEGVTLQPGEFVVLVNDEDPVRFRARYPSVNISGTFGGTLANAGEPLSLIDAKGRRMLSVDYDDERGWPLEADGRGHTLVMIDSTRDPDDPANWTASANVGGSPGTADPVPPLPQVVINEIMADNVSAVPNDGIFPDWIELHNRGGAPVDIGNWSLSDEGQMGQYLFPAGTTLAAGAYLVVWCDAKTNSPGFHTPFSLGRTGETVSLFDAAGSRVDAITFGTQVADYSVGREGELWELNVPTPGAENALAELGSPTQLAINEWLANAAPGTDDWIELFNRDTKPVALRFLTLSTRDDVFTITSLSFIGANGFVVLHADENPGPDHVDFKLDASSDTITLADEVGAAIDSVTFRTQTEGVSQGRVPDGTTTVLSLAGSLSPGAPNYLASYTGPRLNEFMAYNLTGVSDSSGRFADWVEMHNPSGEPVDLSGFSLSTDLSDSGEWLFPAGTTIAANGYLMVWFDGSRAASTAATATLNTGRSLDADGGGIYLFNRETQLVDSVEYGPQIADQSVGRDGTLTWRLAAASTPGATNAAAAELGVVTNLRLNEWMADPASGDDWFEVHNTDSLPIDMGRLYLTDDPSTAGRTNFQVAPLTFIAPKGFVKWIADASPRKGPNHASFNLDRLGETLRIYSPAFAIIDTVDFALQASGESEGRLPDGGTNVVRFTTTQTPQASNYLPLTNLFINEVLTHTDPPLEDAVEVLNASDTEVDISGWFLSDATSRPAKFRVPEGTVVPAKGFAVIYEGQFNADPVSPDSFTFNSAHGDEVFLSAADAEGNLTGFRAQAVFPAAENGVSFGRFQTSVGVEFTALSRRTFGVDNPASVPDFRRGSGAQNAYPKVGPVVLNEIMYVPLTGEGTNAVENPDFEFIELHNISLAAAPLFDPANPDNTWKIDGGVEFTIPKGMALAPGTFALVVSFDPQTDGTTLAAFRTRYSVPAGVPVLGPFDGRLNNSGESIELYKPDPPQKPPQPDAGFVPYILVDRVDYRRDAPWPAMTNAVNASLQRVVSTAYGNEPLNWSGKTASPGRPNSTVADDRDGDGMPNDWELAHSFNPDWSGDGALDSDGDGASNADEFAAGTNPRDASSHLRLTVSLRDFGAVTLHFNAVANRTYSVQWTADVASDAWELLQLIPANSTDRVIEVSDNASATGRYYRVVTMAP